MKRMKKVLRYFLIFLVLLNLLILVTGNAYVYKALLYNYVGIDDLDLFYTREVKTGKPQPWPFSAGYNKAPMPDSLKAVNERLQTIAFLVIKDDSIACEWYAEGYSEKSHTNPFSMTKSFVGALIGFAIQDGYIKNVEQKVSDFIPEYKEGRRSVLCVKDLLQMSAGLRWDENYGSLFSVTTKGYYGTDLHALLMKEEVVATPGKQFNYQSGATELLALILESASGKKLADYAAEKLWIPLGAEHPALWSLDHKDGHEKAYCCFYSNARDFARIGSLYLHQGNWKGKQLLDSAWVKACTTPTHLPDAQTGLPDSSYGLQWWIGPDYYYCRGILGQYMVIMPAEHLVMVRLGHIRDKGEDGKLRDLPLYVKYAREWAAASAGDLQKDTLALN